VTKHYRKAQDGLPVLRGFVSEDRKMINVFCPYCDRYHYHGWQPDAPTWAISHRVAHCVGDTPYRAKGYFVGEITPAKLKGTYK
jgi:hypothetical protein